MKNAAQDEIGCILAILEPSCYVGSWSQPYAGLLTGRFAAGPYSFEVTIKPDLSHVIAPGTAVAREYRAAIMNSAEDILAALEAAGWHLTAYPRMEFRGEVKPFAQFLSGEVAEASSQGGIELTMRFEVNRGRP